MKWWLLNLLTIISLSVVSQTTIWSEDFESYSDGDVVASDNNTNDAGADWTLVNTALNAGTFQVQNSNSINGSNSFSANRANGYSANGSIWTTEVIDVSDYSTIEIGVTIEEVGNLEDEDFIDVEYNLNGGGWTDMTGGQYNNDYGGPLLATDNLSGVLTTLQIRVKSYSDANGEQIIFDDVYVDGITPLPVELLYFNVEVRDTGIMFNWATASEINNDYFELQESNDGNTFNTIYFIEGAGNSLSLIKYSVQIKPQSSPLYYRLKQVDYNGVYDISNVVIAGELKVSPKIIVIYDIHGNHVDINTSGLIIIKYDDGTYKKKINI